MTEYFIYQNGGKINVIHQHNVPRTSSPSLPSPHLTPPFPQIRAACKKLRIDRPLQWAFASANSKLYAHTPSLPQLPIPTLSDSLATYLESTKPFTTDATFEETKARVAAFGAPGGLGERLQARLEAHRDTLAANGESTSWLADWWDDLAYVDFRDSLPFYVSYFYAFADDALGRNGQVQRAASLIKGFAHAQALVQVRSYFD